jgi:hypothetical protein
MPNRSSAQVRAKHNPRNKIYFAADAINEDIRDMWINEINGMYQRSVATPPPR